MKTIHIVPADDVTQEQIDFMAYQLDWSAIKEIEAGKDAPHEIIYRPFQHPSVHIHQVDDYLLDVRYFALRGDSVEELAAALRKHLPTISVDDAELLFANGETIEERQRAIAWNALLAPPTEDARAMRLFDRGFNDPDRAVRRMAILAVGYTGWPQLAVPLRVLAEKDPDADVRDDARAMLNALIEGAK